MKRILTVLFLMITIYGFGQVPSNYLNIRSRYNLIAIKSDSGFHVPGYSTIPNIRGGTWPGAGNIGIDTVNNKFYFYSGGYWREAGSTNYADSLRRSGLSVQMRKNGNWTTQFNLPDTSTVLNNTVGLLDSLGHASNGAQFDNGRLFLQTFDAEFPGLTPAGGDAAKADTSDLLSIDTTGVQDGYVATWDTAGADRVVFSAPTGGSTDSTWHIKFQTGITQYAPSVGDSIFSHSKMLNKVINVYREGKRQVYDDSVGYEYNATDTSIIFHPPLAVNERIEIELKDSSCNVWVSLENNSDGGEMSLTFPTNVNCVEHVGYWQGSNVSDYFMNYGLSNLRLPASTDGYIKFKVPGNDGRGSILTFRTDSINNRYVSNGFMAGAFFSTSDGNLYAMNNGSLTSSIASITLPCWIKIERFGSTLKLFTSPDNTNFTDRYTYTFSSSAKLFVSMNIDMTNKLYEAKGYNLN